MLIKNSERGSAANSSPGERRKRLASGVIMFIISIAVLATLMVARAGRW